MAESGRVVPTRKRREPRRGALVGVDSPLSLAFALFLLFATPLTAQSLAQPATGQNSSTAAPQTTSQNVPEVTTLEAAPTFKVKVNLVLVPVVVRDSKGNAVGNLRREDFQLSDGGKPQVIKYFSQETPETRAARAKTAVEGTASEAKPVEVPAPAPAVAPQRFVAYVFDDLHLKFDEIAQTRQAADRQLSQLRPTDRAALYTTSGMNMVEFTDDVASLHQALFKLRPQPHAVGTTCPNLSYYLAERIVNEDPLALEVGKQQAEEDCHIRRDGSRAIEIMLTSMTKFAARQGVSLHAWETGVTLELLKDVVRRMSPLRGERSVVVVSPGFYNPDWHERLSEIIENATRSNVVINALDARGVYVFAAYDASVENPRSSLRFQYERTDSEVQIASLEELAEGTGGTLYRQNDFDEGFRRTVAPVEYAYVLGFTPQNLKSDGSFHKLKVRLREPRHLTVQARRGYFAPKAIADPAEVARQEVEAAMFSQDEVHEIPVELTTQFFKTSPADAKLSVFVRADVTKLPLRKEGDRNRDELAIYAAVFDRNGNFVTGTGKIVELRLRDQTLARLASGLTIKTGLDLKTGNYLLRVVVRDAGGQLLSAQNRAVQIQ